MFDAEPLVINFFWIIYLFETKTISFHYTLNFDPIQNSYVEAQTPSTSECEWIWRESLKRELRLNGVSLVTQWPINWRDMVLTPGSGRSSGEGNGHSLQCSCLGNPTDGGAWGGYSPWGNKKVRQDLVTKKQQRLNEIIWVDANLIWLAPF